MMRDLQYFSEVERLCLWLERIFALSGQMIGSATTKGQVTQRRGLGQQPKTSSR